LVLGETRGWRAAIPGTQTIRLVFEHPQRLTRISLVFEEEQTTRTQEFVLRWSSDGGRSFPDIVRQQWNFSPPETIREVEEYQVELSNLTVLELIVVPDTSGGTARASLQACASLTRDRFCTSSLRIDRAVRRQTSDVKQKEPTPARRAVSLLQAPLTLALVHFTF
jgi:hypothetical protein